MNWLLLQGNIRHLLHLDGVKKGDQNIYKKVSNGYVE